MFGTVYRVLSDAIRELQESMSGQFHESCRTSKGATVSNVGDKFYRVLSDPLETVASSKENGFIFPESAHSLSLTYNESTREDNWCGCTGNATKRPGVCSVELSDAVGGAKGMAVQSDVEANQYTLKACVESMTAVTTCRTGCRVGQMSVLRAENKELKRKATVMFRFWRSAICCSGGVWGSERARWTRKHGGTPVKGCSGRRQKKETRQQSREENSTCGLSVWLFGDGVALIESVESELEWGKSYELHDFAESMEIIGAASPAESVRVIKATRLEHVLTVPVPVREDEGGFNRDLANNESTFSSNNGFSGGYKPAEDGDAGKPFERRGYNGPPREARGGFRGGRRGGFNNREEVEGERTQRVFERRSGTGRGNEVKRDGGGSRNWGTLTDEITPEREEPSKENEKNVDAEKQWGQEDTADAEV
ncbi:hypothetical protein TEA_004797 [Camellia sinensis var. sinensis]|uniref:Hyaluronan/mRNA-binding protein domain-containing protein n=1 Tax=Camellia sinensis var. sinensis TaxID=542762 RepID=A0A4S4DHB2_CAMSN|nr:hypothetical protein TEA_004797 [Camellia sinensis var. sinensis]